MVNGNELDAVKVYTKVIEINPRTVPALRGLSWLRSRAKNRQIRNAEKAVQMAEFLMKSPGANNNPDLNMVLGSAYNELGDKEKAIRYLNKSLDLALERFALDVIRELKQNFPEMIPENK